MSMSPRGRRCGGLPGCGRLGGSSYEPTDLGLALDVACTDGDYGDESVVTVSWEWQSDDGGTDPETRC